MPFKRLVLGAVLLCQSAIAGVCPFARLIHAYAIDPMIDRMARRNVRFLETVPLGTATGLVAEIYRQVQREFAPPGEPFLIQSPSPEILLGFWLISYEAFTPDRISRALKEGIAVSVSAANRCPYCEHAHRAVGLSTRPGANLRDAFLHQSFRDTELPPPLDRYRRWVQEPGSQSAAEAGISREELPEVAAVAVVFHYINRLINAFTRAPSFRVTEGRLADRMFRAMAEWRVGASARDTHPTGLGLRLAEENGLRAGAAHVPAVFGHGRVHRAFAIWNAIMENARQRLQTAGIPTEAIAAAVRADAPPSDFESLPPAVRYALRVAGAGALDDELVAAVRSAHSASDATLVDLAAWSAYLATVRLAERME